MSTSTFTRLRSAAKVRLAIYGEVEATRVQVHMVRQTIGAMCEMRCLHLLQEETARAASRVVLAVTLAPGGGVLSSPVMVCNRNRRQCPSTKRPPTSLRRLHTQSPPRTTFPEVTWRTPGTQQWMLTISGILRGRRNRGATEDCTERSGHPCTGGLDGV
jgi:hypothetical protein